MAAAPVPPPAPSIVPESAPLSEGVRIVDTFIAPSKTFTDLRRNASWWAPWLLISAVSLLFVFVMGRQIGFEQISKNAITQSARAEQFEKLPPDQQAKQLQLSATVARYISYSLPVLNLIIFVVIAAVLMATFNFGAGAGVPFKTSLAIVIYGSLPGIIGAVLGIVSMFSGVDPAGFNAKNPVATNPAYFMDPTGNQFLYGMASALDVFIIWTIVLMGIGFACNSKVKRSTAIAIVAGWYLLYKLVGSGMAAAFS
jgi:small-conductance mechanosensitive channel